MSLEKLSAQILITGGTIDSIYVGAKDTCVPLEQTCLPDYFKNIKADWELSFVEICMKDSREINQEDRQRLIDEIKKSSNENILITHGTYTMPDTARFLKANLGENAKKIILTGAMIPLTGFSPSDASFNLGYSLASFKSATPGIYVCMNGQVFEADEVLKLVNEGRFSSIFDK